MRLPLPVLLALLGAAFVVLLGLGVWQLQRNEWKQDLVTLSHARTDAEPMALRSAVGLDADEMDFRRVTLHGTWDTERAVHVVNRVRASTLGREVAVPLQPADGGPDVMVNIGWVPSEHTGAEVDTRSILAELPAGETTVSGLARDYSSLDGRALEPGPDVERWSSLAPSSMEEAYGQPLTHWVVIAGEERQDQAVAGEPLPVQGWQRFQNTTPHMEYALTWFGIAAALVAVAVARLVVAPYRARRARG